MQLARGGYEEDDDVVGATVDVITWSCGGDKIRFDVDSSAEQTDDSREEQFAKTLTD